LYYVLNRENQGIKHVFILVTFCATWFPFNSSKAMTALVFHNERLANTMVTNPANKDKSINLPFIQRYSPIA